jgi:hypothetical protein
MRPATLLPSAVAVVLISASCSRIDYLEIEPAQANLQRRGETIWLRAKAMSRNGMYFPRAAIAWSCDNPRAVSIDGAGRVTGVGPGHALCTANSGGSSASVDVDVQTVERVHIDPPSVTLYEEDEPFRPKIAALDENGHELRGRVIDMKSKDEHVANVDGEKIYPVAPGQTQVTVRADDRTQVLDVTVVKGKAKPKKTP